MSCRKQKNRQTLCWIAQVAGKKKIYVFILAILQMTSGIVGVADALFLRNIIDAAVAENVQEFYQGILLFVGLILIEIILQLSSRFLEEYTKASLENNFKGRLFEALLYQEYSVVASFHSGEWMNRLTSDTVVVADGITQIIPGVMGMSVKIMGALTIIFYIEPRFTFVLIPGGLLLIFFTYRFRKITKQLHKRVQEADGKLRIFLQESLSNMIVVRSFSREEFFKEKSWEKMKEHKEKRLKKTGFSNICLAGFGVIMNGVYVIGAAYCGYGILKGTLTYGTFLAVLQLIGQIQNPFANITGYLPRYYAMCGSAERIMEIEKEEKKVLGKTKDIRRFYEKNLRGIYCKKIKFAYPGQKQAERKYVFDEISFLVKKGEYIALTGPSGCGKSTILKLLLCLYYPDKGDCILETDTGQILLTAEYRELFAYVPQENYLMNGTIKEIISFGEQEKINDDEVWQALRIACGEEFVRKLPNGLDTILGERGSGLSEGQMQRLAIARAVFSKRPILLLDESTSALDARTEKQLLANLQLITDKTVFIVTHRPEALSICDKELNFSANGIQIKTLKNKENGDGNA
nr:ABC transporter ATP-binding protein [uncultured Anaerobutyricum sp.]